MIKAGRRTMRGCLWASYFGRRSYGLPPTRCAMADINIQRKKSSPSPWLLVLLVLAVIGVGAYLLLRADMDTAAEAPEETELPAATPADTTAPTPAAVPAESEPTEAEPAESSAPVTPQVLAAFVQSADPAQPTYAREGLRLLTAALVDLADRDDLRDSTIGTRRDDLTSATSRLNEAGSSLRPGFVAAAALMEAMQQKAYPELEREIGALTTQAAELSGRATTAPEQQQVRTYLSQAAALLEKLNQPSTQ